MKNWILILFLFSAVRLWGQVEVIPDLVTDRPDQTESAVTVPLGALQIESGFVLETDKNQGVKTTNTTYNTTLLRYGLFENMELRLAADYHKTELDQIAPTEGFAPLSVGIKTAIRKEKGWIPEMAVLAHITLPYWGKEEFTAKYLAPQIRLAAGHTLTDRLSLGWNLGLEWGDDDPRANRFYSLVMGASLSDKLSAYAELYGYSPEDGDADYRADAGFTYLLRNNLQLDISGGIGLNDVAPDRFVSFGLSWRLPY